MFTSDLIEILVVMAILGTLSAAVLGAVNSARERSEQAASGNKNVEQVHGDWCNEPGHYC